MSCLLGGGGDIFIPLRADAPQEKLVLRSERKTSLGRPKSRWKGIIETDMEKFKDKDI